MVKRKDLERHLRIHACNPHREGGRHTIWRNRNTGARSPVPRHRHTKDDSAKHLPPAGGAPARLVARLLEAAANRDVFDRKPIDIGERYGSSVTDDELSHLDRSGRARMVDVGAKAESERRARARTVVRMAPQTAAVVERGDAPKGDVLGAARLAGIQAAKRTDELIPLAHPLPLTFVDVEAAVDAGGGTVTLTSEARTIAKTGVEMEAMVACAVAALTVYDMVKGIERGVSVSELTLLEKTGGKEDWKRDT